jgi:peptidoglycan/xylan/chitin deacetylase (PgdA/CDA1 family)
LGTKLLGMVKPIASAADSVRRPARGVVILIYHRVGGRSGLEVDLPADLFEAQVRALASSGRVATLDAALDALDRADAPAVDPIVVTFDDGTADFADVAMPILERHGVPATLYVATDFVERGVEFPASGVPVSWPALADAMATGLVTIGSHTHSHALLDRLDPGAVGSELDRSIDLIGARLGVRAEHFAYPKALLGSTQAQAEVRARFRSAAVAGTRPNRYGRTDRWKLARTPLQVADGLRWFERKAAGGMALEDTLRRGLNRVRYRGAGT